MERNDNERAIEIKNYLSKEEKIVKRISEQASEIYGDINWFFMSPVLKGLINYKDLTNGNITLWDLYKLNQVMDIENYIEKKIKEYYENEALNGK